MRMRVIFRPKAEIVGLIMPGQPGKAVANERAGSKHFGRLPDGDPPPHVDLKQAILGADAARVKDKASGFALLEPGGGASE